MPLARHDMVDITFYTFEKFLLTCLLRGMTRYSRQQLAVTCVSTHMPLARHDLKSVAATP